MILALQSSTGHTKIEIKSTSQYLVILRNSHFKRIEQPLGWTLRYI